MEYKKVETSIRREECRQRNKQLKENSGKCTISKKTDSTILSTLECKSTVHIENRREQTINEEEIKLNGADKIPEILYPNETITKDANFEYEEEWDVGGIPELLNELDADIEKSLKNLQNPKFDCIKNAISVKQDIAKKHCEKEVVLNNLESFKSRSTSTISRNRIDFEKNIPASTFTGFSKRGHLISNSTNSNSLSSKTVYANIDKKIKPTKKSEDQGCTISMSSQTGNNGSTIGNISGTGISITCGQSISGSNSSNKTNNKMSIDHQATLDKGLKMKIKRTKPGTKSSEAKHEIVKATEQQQNGLVGSGTTVCSTSQEDVNCLLSNQSSSSNSQSSIQRELGINNSQSNSNTTGNKKILGSGNNQNNISPNNGTLSLNNTGSVTNNVPQTLSQGTKRGSSGHRRDKTKDKSSHTIRGGIEKNILVTNEKETIERPSCHCSNSDGNIPTCSNSSCIRKTDSNTLTQRLPTKNSCGNISVVPPGVFTPSTDASTSLVVSNLLAVTTAISTTVCTQAITSGANTDSSGPSSKDTMTGGNVKISSHIAAQLAAASSNNSSNGSCVTTSSFANTELKSSSSIVPSQIVKQLSPIPISATAAHSAPGAIQKTSSISSTTGTEKLITTLKIENSESPPAKRLKQTDNNATTSSVNKEMVDICIGTSIGTITEPDCLGPCEPGTSVTLEGIVWHETEGGVLVVNVTWRGKTYVGTLLDCTRHDWAPPRFCDSPTDDLDARTPKGRGKRGRATLTPDLSNFTETRSSIYFSHSHVHSKLRNSSTKGGRGTARTTSGPIVDKVNSGSSLSSGNSGSTPSTSPTAFLPPRTEKRKSKDESPPPGSADNEVVNNANINASGIPTSLSAVGNLSNQPQSLINPVTGLNVQISTKKCKTSSPCAISPVLLECPENDCSKKYKHVNGLRYHQSHAHGNTSLLDEDSMAETEEHITPQPSPQSSTPTPSLTPNPSDLIPNNPVELSSQPVVASISEECNTKKTNEEDISQQVENSEKNFPLEAVSSVSCENVQSHSIVHNVPSANETISPGIIEHEQKQFPDLVENNQMNINAVLSLESNNLTGKSGVLRFGQIESKNNNGSCLLPTSFLNENLFPAETIEAGSPKKGLTSQQDSNKDIFSAESIDNSAHQQQNQHGIATNTTTSVSPVISKPKKERKSPSISDYEGVKMNSCNISSREDVQSPAYSDISDDSTPVNDSDSMGKTDVSKNSDVTKKSQDIGLPVSATCPSSQANISSTLSNYGVYQFYQQQQFIVPPATEQQQPLKTTLNANIGSAISQQQNVSEYNSKKDPPLDLISKTSSVQTHSNQHCQEINKDSTRSICVSGSQGSSELSNATSIGSSALNSTTSSKSVPHFYAFNYMPSGYSFNVDPSFGSAGPSTALEDGTKPNRVSRISSPNDQSEQQHSAILYKEDRSKEEICSTDPAKSTNIQVPTKQSIKSDTMSKSDCIKQESACNSISQLPQHMQIQNKDHQGLGVYTNMYQRHPLALSSQHLSREEELRRYYIFSDQQRRQGSSSHNAVNQQIQNAAAQSGNQSCKDDTPSQQHIAHNQQQIKIKGNTILNISKSSNSNTSKESPKHKHDEELKTIKQEGQKPTMETQGPPPPPTSQYFLHPSYLTSSPFGFDPSHPMYRNVLMPATSPYNTAPYHLPMPRYHAPEDLSRNTGTKALDVLHHAANQYYTTHKIHELSERALKSPNNSNSSNVSSGTIKISGSSPNIGTSQHSGMSSNVIGHHAVQNQPSGVTQLPHNLATQTIGIASKQEIAAPKSHGNGPGVTGTTPNESQKGQAPVNSSATPNCNSGSGSNNNGNNISSGSASDSRSPPPQRHVHTHHHTHVGLGYPMYPAPYGAAVLASQQAAAVAVINPFPPGPNK